MERAVRDGLARKVSGSMVGLWLLAGEHLRLGSWDLIKAWAGGGDWAIEPRLALQLVHEAALCVNRIRRKENIAHQGFELLNGLPWVASDPQIHRLLDTHTTGQARHFQQQLIKLRFTAGHYHPRPIWALDPHRLASATGRITPKKKKRPKEPARKTLQTFFTLDVQTGQPLMFDLATAGKTVTTATPSLLASLQRAVPGLQEQSPALLLADSEHFSKELVEQIRTNPHFDLLLPVPMTRKTKTLLLGLSYQRKWAGYAIALTSYQWEGASSPLRLIAQRCGERPEEYTYRGFITTSGKDPVHLLSAVYPQRWTVEEFFNFEQAMGWKRASTLNLNIRYGKMSLALLAQAAMYQLRGKLPAQIGRAHV